ncbi:hypothetical protein PoB_000736100 [Plakobranchus ocellatus]|uniref:Uncharacterized protein n=1 Tax=Plakobranchus ocellatus TaxID=259542 RepID=A0AAV3Y0U4_9GAST|nr:hypothetical protein PoB_000736100 [Plakobranchus ocellatus]
MATRSPHQRISFAGLSGHPLGRSPATFRHSDQENLPLQRQNLARWINVVHVSCATLLDHLLFIRVPEMAAIPSLIPNILIWSVGGTVASESALRSAGTVLSRDQAPPSATRPNQGS